MKNFVENKKKYYKGFFFEYLLIELTLFPNF